MEFTPWPKTPRLFRDIVVTEKIDGTNSAVIVRKITEEESNGAIGHVTVDGDGQFWEVGAQSRNRIIAPGKSTDNYGFAGWVYENAYDMRTLLGEGVHYGEWWGKGIQRGYGLEGKKFSLFNTHRYANIVEESNGLLDVVPVIYQGPNTEAAVRNSIIALKNGGSWAATGYMNPEGVCVYHTASSQVYKVLIENDELPKGLIA